MREAVRWVLRSIAIVPALFFAPYSAVQNKTYDTDPDIWWHIRVGDWIASHHAFPRNAIFSQLSSIPWTAYSWGFELLVSRVHRAFGLPGIPGLLICIEILISLALLLSMRRIAGSFWPGWWIGAATICAAYVNPLRPALLSVLFFTIELFLIFESERTESDRLLYWLAPLFALWANCHIQFVYGIAVFGVYIGARVFASVRKPSGEANSVAQRTSWRRLAGIFALALLGSCIGPNWVRPYFTAIHLTRETFIYQILQEMHAMDFRHTGHYLALLLLMAGCFAVGKSRKKDLFRPALLILCALVSFRSQRDAWFVSIAAAFVIAETLREARGTTRVPESASSAKWPEKISFAAAAIVAIVLSFMLAAREGMSTNVMIAEIDRVYPIRATEFIRDAHLQGPMFNSFNWGGFLIFNLPEYPVSMDPRTDIYGDDGVRRSVATTDGIAWREDPSLARANFVIIERYFPLASALANDPNYTMAYQDQIAMVFVKKQAAN